MLPHSKDVAQVHPTEISRLKGTAKLLQEDRMVLNSKLLKPCENLLTCHLEDGFTGKVQANEQNC